MAGNPVAAADGGGPARGLDGRAVAPAARRQGRAGALGRVSVSADDPPARAGQDRDPGGVVHSAGLHPQRPVRRGHHKRSRAGPAGAAPGRGGQDAISRAGRRTRRPPACAAVLVALTGECLDCGSSVLHARGRCTPCYWKAHREAAKRLCPGCRQQGILRDSGLCGMCTRRARPRKKPALRACRRCGRIAGHEGLGLCAACYQSDPARVVTWTAGALERLGDDAPPWFARLAADLGARCAAAVAKEHLRKVEFLAHASVRDPAAVIAELRVPGARPAQLRVSLMNSSPARASEAILMRPPAELPAAGSDDWTLCPRNCARRSRRSPAPAQLQAAGVARRWQRPGGYDGRGPHR